MSLGVTVQPLSSQLVRSYKMENITILIDLDGMEHVIIDHGNDQFTSMPKAVWDEQQKAAELGGTL